MQNGVYLSNDITGVVVAGFLEAGREESASQAPEPSAADVGAFILSTKLQRPPARDDAFDAADAA